MSQHRNPVLRGSQPDPSVCRFGDQYVLVTSSAVLFPGIPVHVSRDLVHWTRASHVIDRAERLAGTGPDVEDGVWAPSIRAQDGLLYVVYTISVARTRHRMFVSTASSPQGPWSEPVQLEADGFDPSLFFDIDGRAWLTACRDSTVAGEGPGELWMREFDPVGLRLVGRTTTLWHGAIRGAWIEAPHIYLHDGRYHLIAAEGGTERGHSVVAASADEVGGPYRADPRNPLLTHRHLGEDSPFQNIGHADLVDDHDGRTWALVLGARAGAGFHTTGRETFVVPAEWRPEGPVFAPGVGRVEEVVDVPGAETGSAAPALDWVTLRGPVEQTAEGDRVALQPRLIGLSDGGTPSFVAVRQDEPAFRLRATVSPREASVGAGLAVFHHHDRFAAITVEGDRQGATAVRAVLRRHGRTEVLATAPTTSGPQDLWVECDGEQLRLGAGSEALAQISARLFSAEDAGGFGGTLVGLLAIGPSTAGSVLFDHVGYERLGIHALPRVLEERTVRVPSVSAAG